MKIFFLMSLFATFLSACSTVTSEENCNGSDRDPAKVCPTPRENNFHDRHIFDRLNRP